MRNDCLFNIAIVSTKMYKILKPYITIVAGVVFLLLVIWGILFFFQKQITAVADDPESLIPSDAIFVIYFNEPIESTVKLRETIFWKDLSKIEQIDKLDKSITFIDSIVNSSEQVQNLLKESKLWASFHNVQQNKRAGLFNLKLKQQRFASKNIPELLQKDLDFKILNQYKFLDAKIINGKFRENDSLFLSFYKGSLLISNQSKLVETSITQYNSGTNILSDDDFARLKELSGNDDKIYYDLRNLCSNINKIADIDNHLFFDCESFGTWLAWDINLYDQFLTFNGFILPEKEDNLITGVEPQEHLLLPVIPSGSFFLVTQTPAESYFDLVKQAGYTLFVKDVHTKEISPLLAMYINDSVSVSGIIEEYDLNRLNISDYFAGEYDDDMYLYKTDNNKIFEKLIGYGVSEDFEYVIHKDSFLVAFTDIDAVGKWYGFYKNHQTFYHAQNAKSIINHLPAVGNYFVYVHIPDVILFMNDIFTPGTRDFLDADRRIVERFEGLAVQITHQSGKLFQNHAIISHDPYTLNIPRKKWEVLLDSTLNRKLFNVVNHVDNSEEIIVTDKADMLYLISDSGQILWKRKLPEAIMSDIYQIDYYKNNKYQYLFNTPDYIFLIDRLGRDVADYPLKLPQTASAPMAVFDYENNKNYRLLVPTENKTILNLDKTGSNVDGWQYTKSKNIVKRPVQHIRLEEKDFLFVIDTTGVPEILNRRGQVRVKTPKRMAISQNNRVYFDDDPGKSHFMISAKNGHLIEITINGKISKFAIDDFSGNHFFVYHDLNSDGKKDYLFLDNDLLSAYDFTGRQLFSYRFENNIDERPFVFDFNEKGVFIGIADKDAKKIYLISSAEGKNIIPIGIKADVPFVVKKTGTHQIFEIIKGLDKIVRSYEITF